MEEVETEGRQRQKGRKHVHTQQKKQQILKSACVGVNAKQDSKKTFPKVLILFISSNETSCDFYLLSYDFIYSLNPLTGNIILLVQAENEKRCE